MDFSFYFDLPLWIRTALQGIAVIAVLFPISAACSMAERKVAAWVQGRPGPNRAIVPWVAPIPFLGRFLQRLGVFQLMADGGTLVCKDLLCGELVKQPFDGQLLPPDEVRCEIPAPSNIYVKYT